MKLFSRPIVTASVFSPLIAFWLTLGIGSSVATHAADRPPNVVVIMADDLGYGDVSCYGSTAIETPNIDALADDGLRFTSGYCSASTCTPTRYSFLTGQYAFRTPGTGIAPPNSPAIIAAGTPTIASSLRDAGYRTAVIGKWHLGLGESSGPDWNGTLKPGPLDIGFDECLLLPTTNDRVPQVYVRNDRVENLDPDDPIWVGRKKPSPDHPTGLTHRGTLKMDWSHGHNQTIHNGISRIGFYTGGNDARFRDEDLADRWVDESVRFINAHKDEPFFLFFASHDIHVPRMPHERYQSKSTLGWRGDAILELDDSVGRLMAAINAAGIDDHTMVVFCSDNGPVLDDGYQDDAIEKNGDHRPAGPFRGGKYSIYEGGTRTPFIVRMPGRVAPGVSDSIVCTVDLFRSVATVAGADVPEGAAGDSVDVSAALLGDASGIEGGRGHLVVQDNGRSGDYGLRQGKWKLQKHASGKARNIKVNAPLATTPVPTFRLFDLENDPKETKDVSQEHPEVFETMKQLLNQVVAKPTG